MKKGFVLGFLTASVISGGVLASNMLSDVYINNFPIKLNGQAYTAEMPVLNYQGRTYLALREFGTVTNNEVDFIDNTIIINNSNYTTQKPSTPISTPTTLGQKNALAKAKDYLNFSAFSYTGLIKQLEFEGFTAEEAKYAADNCRANWKEQAAKKAKSYISFSSFSRKGLIGQLEFEGFTTEEAEYGVTAVGY